LYVNGVDATDVTNINDILADGLQHHVVVVFNESASSDMRINESQDGLSYGVDTMYNNLAIYDYQLTSDIVNSHYSQYIGLGLIYINDTSMAIVEKDTGTDSLPFFLVTSNLAGTNI
jgi:hypothetical protein